MALGAVKPAAQLGDGALEAARVRTGPGLADAREVARGVLGVARDKREVIVEQRPPQVAVEVADHPQVNEADLGRRLARLGVELGVEHEEVARVEVRVEKAVGVEHPDDALGPQVDDALADGLGQRAALGRVGPDAAELLHRHHQPRRVLAVDLREADVGLVCEVDRELLCVVRLAPEVDLAQRVFGKLVENLFGLVP